MENARIKRLAVEWLTRDFKGWRLLEFINAGKTALVFKAKRGDDTAAVKIFDPEAVERYSRTEVEERLHRELTLIGKHHENLVQIFDGGHIDADDLYFVVMEYIEGGNLSTALTTFPVDAVRPVIRQIAAAAKFLEDQGIVHRDIKPDNIGISCDFKRAVLLDLGVIRPFRETNDPAMTDREEQLFIGTHRYSPPEFVLRREKQNLEGFRAITFYQLGAVLHDLLMKQRLYQDSASPFARLVQSILHDVPRIDPAGKPHDLVLLANNCLVKEGELRTQIVSWSDFESAGAADTATAAKERIRKRRLRARYEHDGDSVADYESVLKREQTLGELSFRLAEQVRAVCVENDLPPRFVKQFPDKRDSGSILLVIFKSSVSFGLPIDFYAALRLALLDLTAQVVLIEYACAVSCAELAESELTGHWRKIYNGVYEDSAVRSAVETAIFPTFERALDLADVVGTQWLSTHEGAEKG